jgi:hypothetical protein
MRESGVWLYLERVVDAACDSRKKRKHVITILARSELQMHNAASRPATI